jgi:hypothetical protein
MKFSVGYRVQSSDVLVDEIIKRKDDIYEVYCSWGAFPSGRNDQTRSQGLTPWEAQSKQIQDLDRLAKSGLKLNLLFNANCYGEKAQSRALFNEIGETLDYASKFNLTSVTTTSPLIAKFVKQNFERIDVRASVNMKIGTVHGLDYVKEYFDSFYVQREKNRDFTALKQLRKWCDDNGKEMYLLANSGCLNDCSFHTFHDNLVAHEKEISKMDNGYVFESGCKKYLSKEENREWLLSGTSYIRPEDVYLYEGLVPSMKLATRVHNNPVKILRAYIDNAKYVGNLLELLEPDHSGTIYPYVLENKNVLVSRDNDKLIYSSDNTSFVKLEDNYAYQQND